MTMRRPLAGQNAAPAQQFRRLPPVEPHELTGLWKGRGIPSGHPLDGVLENLGWFGKRFTPGMRADALLFRSGERGLVPVDPAWIPIPLALRFSRFGRTGFARNLFSNMLPRLWAKGPVASVKVLTFEGVASAAMVYDTQPIIDHFRRIDEARVMGMMAVEGDDRRYFFELTRIDDPLPEA